MPSNTDPKTILLKGSPLADEGKAGGAITPGHLITRNSSGLLVVHPTHGGLCPLYIAKEAEVIGGGIDKAYASGDNVSYWVGRPGDQFWAWLKDGQNATAGSLLMSTNDGTFQLVTSGGTPIARVVETKSTVGGASAAERVKVEVI